MAERKIKNLDWNQTGLLDKYGDYSFCYTDILDMSYNEMKLHWPRLSAAIAAGHIIHDRWQFTATEVFRAVDDVGVKVLTEIQPTLEP